MLIIDDDEAYSQGLVNVMVPILKKAGIKVDHQTLNGTDTGATLADGDQVARHLASDAQDETVAMLPWQTATNAQQFGQDAKQAGKTTILFGTDGTNSPSQFNIPGSYVSAFGPDISGSTSALDKSIVTGVAKYGPYGPFGVPTYEAADVVMKAIASVCKSGQTPSRSNVLAAIKTTNIPASDNPLGVPVAFAAERRPRGQHRLPVQDQQRRQVRGDPAQVRHLTSSDEWLRGRRRPRYCAGGAAGHLGTQRTGTRRAGSSSKHSSTGWSPVASTP